MIPAIPHKDSWKYCPRCGQAAAVEGCHPFHCENCEHCHYFSPCTAVGAIILDSEDRALFVVRGKDPGKGRLGLPGGFVDAGESAEDALRREVSEEVNLEVTTYNYLASFPNTYEYRGVVIDVTDLFFVTRVLSFENIEAQEHEVSGWRFVAIADVKPDTLAFDTHDLAIRAFQQLQTR